MSELKGINKEQFNNKFNPDPELTSLKSRLNLALGEIDKLKLEIGSDQKLFDYIKESIGAVKPLQQAVVPKPKSGKTEYQPALIWSDWHSEESVDPDEMEGLAKKYDHKEFKRRLFLSSVKTVEIVNIMRAEGNIKKLWVWCLGDNYVGEIHPIELMYGTSMPLQVAIVKTTMALVENLRFLAQHFEEIEVVGMCGNHGRTTKKPATKMAQDRNWDYTTYLFAEEFCKDIKNIKWNIPRSKAKVIDVMGWKQLLTHGDICARTHTSPYFGIERAIKGEYESRHNTNEQFDHAHMGHWHFKGIIENNIYIHPSLVGPQQFSQYRMHKKSVVQQNLLFFTEKHGITSEWSLDLG